MGILRVKFSKVIYMQDSNNLKLACMKYLKDNGLTNLLEFDNIVQFYDNLRYNEKNNTFFTIQNIKDWNHSSPVPDYTELEKYSNQDLAEIERLYKLSQDASQGKLIVCDTHTSTFLKPVAREGCLQWCKTDNYLKIFIDGEFRSVDYRIGARNLNLPISNGFF